MVLCCFFWSIFTPYTSSSFSLTQQPFVVLPRSTAISASGTCQVWRPWNKVSSIVDISGGPLLFYLVHFTSDVFIFLLPNTTAFNRASSFNADISNWVVSSVTNMRISTLPIVESGGPLLFLFGPFHIWPFLLPPLKYNSLFWCSLVQRWHQQLGRVKCNKHG